MIKVVLILGIVCMFVADSACWRSGLPIIFPTYRPPPSSGPIIRTARATGDQPLWLYQGSDIPRAPASGDHPFLPTIIDDIKLDPNRRYARSMSTPSRYQGGSHTISSSSHNTGPTHPGYNRRNARSVDSPSAKRGGGSHSTSSGSRNTGPTHPGYNRRNS